MHCYKKLINFHFFPYFVEPRELSQYSGSLRAGRSGDRIPMGARFSTPLQTGSEFHPASYTMGTGSFPGLKQPGRGVDHPPQSSAKVKERVELYLYSPSRPSWPVLGWNFLYFSLLCNFLVCFLWEDNITVWVWIIWYIICLNIYLIAFCETLVL